MKYHFIFITLCISLFFSCDTRRRYDSSKPTEFFYVDSGADERSRYEAFVVYNHPRDTLLLLKMVENYNLRTMSLDLLKQPDYKGYTRAFYKRSEFLTRDFESGAPDTNPRSPYTYQELNAFKDDKLLTIRYAKRYDGSYRYSYHFKRNLTGGKDIIIHNLDSFCQAKWIETADIDTTMVK